MRQIIAVILLGFYLSACGGGGSSSSRDGSPQPSAPPPATPTPATPAPIADVADYQLQNTADVLASVEERLQGLPIAQFFEEAYRVTAQRDPESIMSADAENYLLLLNQLGRRFRQIEVLLDARAAAGIREPFFTFDYSRSQVASIAAG